MIVIAIQDELLNLKIKKKNRERERRGRKSRRVGRICCVNPKTKRAGDKRLLRSGQGLRGRGEGRGSTAPRRLGGAAGRPARSAGVNPGAPVNLPGPDKRRPRRRRGRARRPGRAPAAERPGAAR